MALRAGDVVVLYATTTRPAKWKWHLCVSVSDNWFLRINTKAQWNPNFPLVAATDTCLNHDCYLELGAPVYFSSAEIARDLSNPRNHKGRLSDKTLRALTTAISSSTTLTKGQKAKILAAIQAELP